MSSSECEEFESADEEFEDKLSTTPQATGATKLKQTDSSNANVTKAKQPEETSLASKRLDSDNVSCRQDLVNENKNKSLQDNVSQGLTDLKIQEKVSKSENILNDKNYPMKKENKEFANEKNTVEEKIETTEIPKNLNVKSKRFDDDNGNDNDDWDFEDWGFDTTNDAPETKREPCSNLIETHYDSFPILNKINSKSSPAQEGTREDFQQPMKRRLEENPAEENISSNWGWKPWGNVVSFLSSASDSVATLTSHVSSVIESGIGVPNPDEMARIQLEEKQKHAERLAATGAAEMYEETKEDRSEILGNLMQGVTTIGNRVIYSGLDTLEEIGKKTMTIIQENDPGLLNKRKLMGLNTDGQALSQVLREAKEKSEESERSLKMAQKHTYRKQLHFESLFDEYHGLVYLEALEMLSKQSVLRLQSLIAPLSGVALDDIQETLNEVKELCELPDQDSQADENEGMHTVKELQSKFEMAIEDLDITMNFNDILQCWRECVEWFGNENEKSVAAQAVHDKALRCLAHTSALAIHKLHKIGELLLIKDCHSTANEADAIVQLTIAICWHLSGIGNRFGGLLSQIDNTNDVNSFITSIFLEASNSISYIKNAFQLFIPILQIGAA